MATEIALVTGASSGLGAAFCRALAPRCKRIVAVARRGEALDALAEELKGETEVVPIVADLASVEGVARTMEALRQRGVVTILVNNAGFGSHGAFAQSSIGDQQGMVNVHIDASLSLSRAALPFMRELGRGAIINLGSVTALAPLAGTAVYAATKAFLVNYSLALQEEERAYGIKVQCLCPGLVRSEFHATPAFADFNLGGLPDEAWLEADAVVSASLAALEKGAGVIVVPGEGNRQMALAGLQRQLESLQ